MIFFSKSLCLIVFCLSAFSARANLSYSSETSDKTQDGIVSWVEKNQTRLKEHLARHHVGIELITAGGTWNSPISLFGHTMLRFIDTDDDPLNDTLIGFEMLVADPNKIVEKGLKGGYENFLTVREFNAYLITYALKEARSTIRTILPSSPKQISDLKKAIERVSKVPDFVGDYDFLKNNCASAMLRLLSMAGYPMFRTVVDIPGQLNQRLRNAVLTYAPDITLESFDDFFHEKVCDFLKKQNVSFCTLTWIKSKVNSWDDLWRDTYEDYLLDPNFWSYLDANLTPLEKSYVTNLFPHKYTPLKSESDKSKAVFLLFAQFQIKNQNLLRNYPPSKLIPSIPLAAYRSCEPNDLSCRKERVSAIAQIWDLNEIKQITKNFARIQKYELRRAKQLIPSAEKTIISIYNSDQVNDMIRLSEDLKNYKNEN